MDIKELEGKTLVEIVNDTDTVTFTDVLGNKWQMYHSQDCCENVYVESIVGDLEDLLNTPILLAEERTENEDDPYGDTMWTFYCLRTIKGTVDIRWVGSSNGYYSVEVSFGKVGPLT